MQTAYSPWPILMVQDKARGEIRCTEMFRGWEKEESEVTFPK